MLPKREFVAPLREAASNQQPTPASNQQPPSASHQPPQIVLQPVPQTYQHPLPVATAPVTVPPFAEAAGTALDPHSSVAGQASSSAAPIGAAGGVATATRYVGKTEPLAVPNANDSPLPVAAVAAAHAAAGDASCAQPACFAGTGPRVSERSLAEDVVQGEMRGPVVTVSPPSTTVGATSAPCVGSFSASSTSCNGASCRGPSQLIGSEMQSSVLELTCQVIVDGEHKSVTFSMDFLHDTPRAVAKEMVDELHMEESDATITDIIRQIELFRPAHTNSLVQSPVQPHAEALTELPTESRSEPPMESSSEPPLESLYEAPVEPLGATFVQPQMPSDDVAAESQHALLEHARPTNAQGYAQHHSSAPKAYSQVPTGLQESLALQRSTTSGAPVHAGLSHMASLLTVEAPTTSASSLYAPRHKLDHLASATASALHPSCAQASASPPTPGAGGTLGSAAASDVVELELGGPHGSGRLHGDRDCASVSGASVSVLAGATSLITSTTLPPVPSHALQKLDLLSPIAGSTACFEAAPCSSTGGGSSSTGVGSVPPTHNAPPLVLQGSAFVSASATTAPTTHAHAVPAGNGVLVYGNGSVSMTSGSSITHGVKAQSGGGGGGRGGSQACTFDDDDDGDMDDNEIMQRIEIQQLREIEEMKERHRKQNTRMIAMIQRRALERASRRGAEADVI